MTADAKSRAYGDVNPALTYQVGGSGLVNGDTLSGALATSATTASNVGTYGIGQGTLAASGNYALNYASADLTVGQRAITVTADAKSRAYGDVNPALTYQVGGSGLVNGDTLSGALATSATTASNVGTYGIGQGTLAASGNYALNYASADLTVGQRAITVTADAKSRAYGDVNPALTYQVGGSGLVNGDSLSGALATSATTASNVGTYGIGQGTLAASGNYALNYASADLTVTQRAITVTADAKSRAYGNANPALTYQVSGSGLVNGDTLSGALATSATTSSNVGTYGIGQGTLAASGNYALNYTSNNLTVTQRAITVTADAKSRAYGDANPALTYQVSGSGLVNGDTLSGALATSATTSSNVGVYGITQGALAASGNYTLNYASADLTVTQRAITVTADAKSRAYGDANPALTYQVSGSGLVNGDTLSGALATSATTSSNVGTYGIGQGTLAASGNYALNYTSNNLTITQRAITVTADAKSRAYGDANPALTYQVGGSGLVNGDTLSGALATSATIASNVGVYGITQGTLAASGNYALNYASADLTVGQRAITVTADAKSRAYGDANPALTYQVSGSGLVNGDTLSGALATSATTSSNVGVYGITQGTLAASGNYALNYASADLTVTQRAITVTADAKSRAYGDANPALTYQVSGSGLVNGDTLSGALATSATTSSNVGTYGIGQGTLAASGNYALNYTSNNLTITQRAITVTADAKSRAYGDVNPALTYQVGGSGLVNGDTLSGALATSATTASNVGVYGITQGTLAASTNYALNYASANLTVTQRAITVTADAKSRTYGDANPALTYQVSGSGLVNGDTLSGALATSATAASNVGDLRHYARQPRGFDQLRTQLCKRQPDGHPTRDHGDGRREEPRLWRRQSGADLSGRRLGSGQWRYVVGRAGDVGDNSQQRWRLRDHARKPRSFDQLRTELCECQSHRHPTGNHRDGRREEPRLWRSQSCADLSGRRLGTRQWRYAVGCAGDVGYDVQRCRRLRHHAGDAGGLIELRLRLCWSEPHGYASGDPSRTDRRTRSLREVAGGFARAAAARADARAREHRATVARNHL